MGRPELWRGHVIENSSIKRTIAWNPRAIRYPKSLSMTGVKADTLWVRAAVLVLRKVRSYADKLVTIRARLKSEEASSG